MNYFTPELYVRSQSPDAARAEAAETACNGWHLTLQASAVEVAKLSAVYLPIAGRQVA